MDLDALHRDYLAHVAALQKAAEAALEEHHFAALVIHSGTAQKRSAFDDQYWPLRAVPHFLHWAPLEVADCAIVVAPGRKPTLYRNVARDFWDGHAPVEDARFLEALEVVDIADPSKMKDQLPGGRAAFIGEDLARAAEWGFVERASVNPTGLLAALDRRRTLKTGYERSCIAEANRRAAAGHAAVREAFLRGDSSELDLHLLYLRATAQDDPETPYKNIVALGPHAATLHHVHYGRRPSDAQSLLLDAGAAFRGYHSDITRTYVKGQGATAAAFAQLVDGLERLQQETCRRVRVGVKYERLHDDAHELLAPILRDVGLVRAADDEMLAAGVTRLFLPHGLGHSLGLQTHDVGCAQEKPRADNPFLRNTAVIAADQCFTIEPGCYFIDEKLEALRASPLAAAVDWKLVDALRAFGGVRIEDDLLVREDGIDNLTRDVLPA